MRDEKLHAVVARSTFQSKNAQSTPCSDHFWKLRRRKNARRPGAKHISRSKCTKFWGVQSTFGRSDVLLRGRHKGLCTWSKISKTGGFCSSFIYNSHYTTLHYTPLHHTTPLRQLQLQLELQLHYITLRPTTWITLHYLYYIKLHHTTPHHTTLP